MNCCVGIVTYHPEIDRLRENIEAICGQVDEVIIVDNGSSNIKDVELLVSEYENVSVLLLCENKGIAFALNCIVDFASNHGYEWCLTLDQDSVSMPGLIAAYTELTGVENVGMMSCCVMDRNMNTDLTRQGSGSLVVGFSDVPYCITSGSFMNVAITKAIGGFDDKMFIDKVDLDISLNMKKHGYRIIKANYTGLLHELGHAKAYKTITGKTKYMFNHSPRRRYYMMRNAVYCCKKYKSYIPFRFLYSDLCAVIPVFLHEDQKLRKLWAEISGLFHGMRMGVEEVI